MPDYLAYCYNLFVGLSLFTWKHLQMEKVCVSFQQLQLPADMG